MLQSTISNAEQLEEFAKNELSNLADIVFRSKVVNNESQKLKNGAENRLINHSRYTEENFPGKSEGQDAFENDAGNSFSISHQQIKMENDASRENPKNVGRAGSRFQCQDCVYSSTDKSNLTKHIQKGDHKYVKEFECTKCGGIFFREHDLAK